MELHINESVALVAAVSMALFCVLKYGGKIRLRLRPQKLELDAERIAQREE